MPLGHLRGGIQETGIHMDKQQSLPFSELPELPIFGSVMAQVAIFLTLPWELLEARVIHLCIPAPRTQHSALHLGILQSLYRLKEFYWFLNWMIPAVQVMFWGKCMGSLRVLGRLPVRGGRIFLLIIMAICWTPTMCQSLCHIHASEIPLLAWHPYTPFWNNLFHSQFLLNGQARSNNVLYPPFP